MTEDKKKNGISAAAATIINGLIGGVFGIIIALIGVGFFPFLNPGLQDLQKQNAELQAQLSRTIPAPKNSDTWTDQNGRKHRYWVCQGFADWEKAEAFCETLGGHLATIVSREEQTHIEEYVKANAPIKTCLWIGVQENNGNWNKWVGGESLEYKHWGGNYPRLNNDVYIGAAFSNYETLTNSDKTEVLNRGEWNQLRRDENYDVAKLNPDGWLICEWDD